MRSGKQLTLISFLMAAFLAAQGCSSSQTSGEDPITDMAGLESGADEVGSIPEDMLASEELPMGSDSLAPAEPGLEDAAADMVDPSTDSDPFADLATAESSESLDSFASSDEGGETQFYEVKAGDTLMKIAFSLYGDIDRWKDLHEWNKGVLKKASLLKVGMKLTYESPARPFEREHLGHSYVIKQGDTLAGIADEVYGRKMKFRKLQRYNKNLIKNPDRIFAGFTIFYDITAEEMAEAEARRKERMAGGGMSEEPVPSSLVPPVSSGPSQEPVAAGPLPPPPADAGMAPPPPPPGPASTAQ